MAGAYVAKPDAATPPFAGPPGWNPIWPWVGPFPPGYVPELSLGLTGPAHVKPGNAAQNIEATLYDHSSYVTDEPAGDRITYSAELKSDSSALGLRFIGDPDFLGTVSGPYIDVGSDFWGSVSDLEFEITVADVGDFVILRASSSPFFSLVSHYIEIEIVSDYTWTAKLVVTHTPHPEGNTPGPKWTDCSWQARFGTDGGDSIVQRGSAWVSASGSSRTDYESEYGDFVVELAVESKEVFTIVCFDFISEIYTLKLGSSRVSNTTMAISMVLTMYGSGGQEDVYTKDTVWPVHVSGAWDYVEWLTVTGGDGTVTIINP